MPDLSDDLPGFSASWWKWWRYLQPSWRTQDPPLLSRQVPPNPDWSVTNKGTPNSIFVVILALGWWALGVKYAGIHSGDLVEDLLHAVNDTTWVLQQMAVSRLGKRMRVEDDQADEDAKRYAGSIFS